MDIAPVIAIAMISFTLGVGVGYAIRAAMSRHRRARGGGR